jgi:membrane-associated phospholipid phosphatase
MNKGANWWFLVPAALFLSMMSLLLMQLPYGEEVYLLNYLRYEPFNTLGRWLTLLGEWHPWVLAIIVLAWKQRKFAVILAVGSIVLGFVSMGLKSVANHERPGTWVEKNAGRELVLVPDVHVNKAATSFPSGHTISAFTLFFVLSQLAQYSLRSTWGLAFAFCAIATAVSRVFLVQHFLADVVAGGVIGILFGYGIWWTMLYRERLNH